MKLKRLLIGGLLIGMLGTVSCSNSKETKSTHATEASAQSADTEDAIIGTYSDVPCEEINLEGIDQERVLSMAFSEDETILYVCMTDEFDPSKVVLQMYTKEQDVYANPIAYPLQNDLVPSKILISKDGTRLYMNVTSSEDMVDYIANGKEEGKTLEDYALNIVCMDITDTGELENFRFLDALNKAKVNLLESVLPDDRILYIQKEKVATEEGAEEIKTATFDGDIFLVSDADISLPTETYGSLIYAANMSYALYTASINENNLTGYGIYVSKQAGDSWTSQVLRNLINEDNCKIDWLVSNADSTVVYYRSYSKTTGEYHVYRCGLGTILNNDNTAQTK